MCSTGWHRHHSPRPTTQALESHCSGFTRPAASCVKGSGFSSVKMGMVRMPTHCVILNEIIEDLFITVPGTQEAMCSVVYYSQLLSQCCHVCPYRAMCFTKHSSPRTKCAFSFCSIEVDNIFSIPLSLSEWEFEEVDISRKCQ